ncbi:MAG: biotin/lipoyl-containing protein, partial [Candidatus Dormibacteria bacterium]
MANKTLEVTLPQMGESVTEGVVGSWHKRVGDQVEAGETLVEIQTDKVDAEVPSPDSGRLAKILAQEGETVAVGASLAEIEVLPSGNGQGPQGDGQVAPAPAASTETPASPGPIAAAVAPAREDAAAPPTVQEPVAVPLPQMGESVSEGVVGSWHKRVGDQVEAGETLVEIQTDKVDAEVPSPVAGKVLEILVQEGETVSAGTILARIEPGSLTAATAPAAEGASSASSSMPVAPQVTPAGSGGQVADATPLARRRAERQGIPLVGLQGSGPDGLVRGRDVDSGSAAVQAGSGQRREEPIKGSRLALVQAMEESLKIPTATSVRTFEVGILEARRRQLNQALHRRPQPLKVSYTHLIAFALVRAAREQPVFSTSFRRTKDAPQKVTVDGVNLGLAVDQEKADGSHFLLVPVIRGAEALDFTAFHKRYEEMVAKVRQGGLQVDELEGATLTLTNPGGVGTVASVPRLMPGQATIVAVGAIGLPPGFRHLDRSQAEGLGLEPVITMTSTYDHRLVQGVESGLLLARLEQLLGGADGFYEAVAQSLRVELGQLPPRPAPGPAPGSSPAPNQDLMYAV